MEKNLFNKISLQKRVLLFYDLYWLRYQKPGEQWYELTDYLRDCLVRDGVIIKYDDKAKDVIVTGCFSQNETKITTISVKNLIS